MKDIFIMNGFSNDWRTFKDFKSVTSESKMNTNEKIGQISKIIILLFN